MRLRQTTTDPAVAADAIRPQERFLISTHETPDGDALGSLLAAKLAFDQFGKDSVMYLTGDVPLPQEYAFMPLDGLGGRPRPPTPASACSSPSTARRRRGSASTSVSSSRRRW